MRFRTDDRAVTVQIGTVLLFAVLIVLLSVYQASVVPQQNEEVEFNHNQQVQTELQDLRDELRRTAVTGSGGSTSVTLGMRYPVRAFFVNPSPPSGTLRTTGEASFTVENAVADGEVYDYWNGSARNFSTAGLVYDPDYNEYRGPPTTVYRNGILYNRFEDANLTLGGQRLVQGDRISLVALGGTLSEASSGAASVDAQPVSTATRTVTVRNESADENVTIVVPTTLSGESAVELWNESLADQSRVRTVEGTTVDDGASAVRIVLDPGTYELELAKVGVGTDVSDVEPHYVTDVRGDNASVEAGGNQQMVVEVRDRYNNPVSGATVNVTTRAKPVTPKRAETGADGRATFVYEASEGSGRKSVAFDISDSPLPREKATVDLHVDGGSDGSGDGGNDTYDVDWTDVSYENSDASLDCESGAEYDACVNASVGTTVELTANVTEDGDPVTGAVVDFARNDSSDDWSLTDSDVTDDGIANAILDVPEENTSLTAYAASGDDVDPIRIEVEDPETGGSADPALSSSVVDQGQTGSMARYEVSYDVDNRETFDRVEVSFENLDSGGADETYTSTDPRANIDDYGWEDERGGTGGHTYEITIEVFDTDGNVVDSRTVTDEADGVTPSGNDDLSEADSPELGSSTLTDNTEYNNGEYLLQYDVSDPADKFTETEVLFANTDDAHATGQDSDTGTSGSVSYSAGGVEDDEYRIFVQVQDDDGVVVDQEVINDTADGSVGDGGDDPAEQTLQPVESEGVNSDSQLTFTVENAGSESVTVTTSRSTRRASTPDG